MAHELKTDPEVFDFVADGVKTWEIRKDDRNFRVGDNVLLRRTKYTGAEMADGAPLIYTGEQISARITYILRGPLYGLREGWVIFSIVQEAMKDDIAADIQRILSGEG